MWKGDAEELDAAVRVSHAAAIPLPGSESQQVPGWVTLPNPGGEGGSGAHREVKERKTSPIMRNNEGILGSVLTSSET